LRAYFAKVVAIVWKDLVAELRTKEMFSSMLVFALLVIVIFNFAFELKSADMTDLAPGMLWVAFTFAGVLGLNRSFALEKDRGALEGLMLTPLDRSGIYVAKMLSNLIFMSLVELMVLPLFWVLSNLMFFPIALIPVVILGTLGFVAIGSLFAAMTVNARAREVMLPVLLFPVAAPLIVAAVKATGTVLAGQPLTRAGGWLQLLLACDVIFLVLSILTFEYVIEE
jgi:heme exporter protein B